MDQDDIVESKTSSSGWLWLYAFATFGLFAASGGKVLLAMGFFLLGVFACFNDPTKVSEPIPSKPSNLLLFSWACGLAGILAVISAAFA